MARTLMLCWMLFASSAIAQELGVYGTTYRVAEPDMLEMIQKKAKDFVDSGRYETWKKESIERAKNSFAHPEPAPMSTLPVYRRFTWDPTVTATKGVDDPQGNVIVPAGTAVNPLDYVSMTEQLLFFDGRDERQVAWATKEALSRPSKMILTAGAWLDLSGKLGRRVFFDVSGWLTSKFGITAVPAIVRQEGRLLAIEEGLLVK
ncbi:MAG: type-F conjugative transfer system protein TraW [Sulfuritalea sp.]|nr:type-F conjugative transfer system protein TraW [Sulfuritalea sp.]